MDRINACIANRKPALLALLLVDVLKDSGWSPDDVHFLGSEIIEFAQPIAPEIARTQSKEIFNTRNF